MSKVAFLGLGTMGTQMARRLIEAGHEVTVWNRTTQRTEPFALTALAVADTPAGAGAPGWRCPKRMPPVNGCTGPYPRVVGDSISPPSSPRSSNPQRNGADGG
jgi:NAD(P)-dependent dehydrogenase (short-subunit alcohol dehydrogenase family)